MRRKEGVYMAIYKIEKEGRDWRKRERKRRRDVALCNANIIERQREKSHNIYMCLKGKENKTI